MSPRIKTKAPKAVHARAAALSKSKNRAKEIGVALFVGIVLVFVAISNLQAAPLMNRALQGKAAPASFADLVENLSPAVVNIRAITTIKPDDQRQTPRRPDFLDRFFPRRPNQNGDGDNNQQERQPRQSGSLGSGFFIDAEGHVVTNNHVIGEADEITVILSGGKEYPAKLVGKDDELDIALLKVLSDDKFPFVSFGSSEKMRVGDWVIAIGNPYGLGGSVTAGIVSGSNREVGPSGGIAAYIQTDASINKGNSGGPMFNMDGDVIGVNTLIFSPTGGNIGIGFAIPSKSVKRTVDNLKEFGRTRRGWIGVSVTPVTKDVADAIGLSEVKGAIIQSVVPDGPAETAGMEAGDVILKFGGSDVAGSGDLVRIVSNVGVDAKVEVVVYRNGKNVEMELITLERETNLERNNANAEDEPDVETEEESNTNTVIGMKLSDLTTARRQQFEIAEDVDGVVIISVEATSGAARRGLRRGDVISHVNQTRVSSAEDVEEAIKEARDNDRTAVLIRIHRGGTSSLVGVPLPVKE